MLNSNLLEVLARAQLELAVLYAGNPCQMALAHALGIPFVLVDLEGLSDETLIAAGVLHTKTKIGQIWTKKSLISLCFLGFCQIWSKMSPISPEISPI